MLLNKKYDDGHLITKQEIIDTYCQGDKEDIDLLIAHMKDAIPKKEEQMKKTATLITTAGKESEIELTHTEGKGFDLHEMYKAIGNGCDMVQVVYLKDGRLMWLDEEGKLRYPRAPQNDKATELLAEAGGISGDIVIGNVIITEGDE